MQLHSAQLLFLPNLELLTLFGCCPSEHPPSVHSAHKALRICLLGTWLMTNASLKDRSEDFPGGPVVKNPPVSAGGHGFHLWSRKIASATGQLGQCTTTAGAHAP